MSGGGLNYLHKQDLSQLSSGSDLNDAIAYLKNSQLGNKAANYSQCLKNILGEATSITNDLNPVWEAIDKYLSHDWSDEDVDKALKAFNKTQAPSSILQAALANAGNNIAIFTPEPDRALFELIAQNTKALSMIQRKLNCEVNIDNIQKLSKAFADLADAQSKLVAIAQTQEPNVKRVFDYAEYIHSTKESAL